MDKIINVLEIIETQKKEIKNKILELKKNNINPTMKVILVGSNKSSLSYVKGKEKMALELGINLEILKYSSEITEEELLLEINKLNNSKEVHGFIVQLPLPLHIDEKKITLAIKPLKDIDGFHPINQGNNLINNKSLLPCTPKGIMKILSNFDLNGKHVVVVGRSNIVGKPVALMCLAQNATVSIVHSKTKNIKEITKMGDILIVAVGRAHFIDSSYIKKDSIIIDVGINYLDSKLVGDVNTKDVLKKCLHVTPVPKGVGPMTIIMLLDNLIEAINLQGENNVKSI